MPMLSLWPSKSKIVIGMVHLLPLPGSPRYAGDLRAVGDRAIADAKALAGGGVHGIMIENFGDAPFFPGPVPSSVVAHLTALAAQVRQVIDVPLGINMLRNDGRSALAIAHAVGAAFIRVNILCGGRVTDQGVIQGIAHDLQRDRAALGAGHIKVMADVDVKHASPLGERRAIEDEVDDTIHRGLADAVIASGASTGKATDPAQVGRIKAAAGATPVFVGSGASAETIASLFKHCDGVIVGSALKVDGVAANPVDPRRVEAFMKAGERETGDREQGTL